LSFSAFSPFDSEVDFSWLLELQENNNKDIAEARKNFVMGYIIQILCL
jgi:hypothetical protein